MLRNIAREKNWLIDIPNKSRKFHHRPTPLTGGIAIQLSMILGFLSLLFLADVKLEKEVFDLFSNNAETVDRTVYKKSLRLEESGRRSQHIRDTTLQSRIHRPQPRCPYRFETCETLRAERSANFPQTVQDIQVDTHEVHPKIGSSNFG